MAEDTNQAPKPEEQPTSTKPASDNASEATAKAAPKGGKVKAEKPPAPEEKPFAEFVHQDYLPALKEALSQQGVSDLDLKFEKQRVPLISPKGECWQVIGQWQSGKRQFNLYFPKADIKGPRAFSCSADGTQASTIEPFLMDERKITLDLLVFGVVQRLNAQKWLAWN
jgi:Protein of unknown function (DUF2996)